MTTSTTSAPAATTVLTNAFSLNMVDVKHITHLRMVSIADWQAAQLLATALRKGELRNAIGHANTDELIRGILTKAHHPSTISLPVGERLTVKMSEADSLIVAQYSGPRLPEGSTELPEGAKIEFVLVQLLPHGSVNIHRAAELAYGCKIKSVDGNETDVGGWPIVGHYELETTGKVVGSWGPTTWETGYTFPNGLETLGY